MKNLIKLSVKSIFQFAIGNVFTAVIFYAPLIIAQPNIEWQKTIGGSDADTPFSVQQTSDGGYILGGGSSSNISGDKTDTIRGLQDYWVVKLDATRAIEWQKTLGGTEDDVLLVIQQTNDGGYILGGWSESNIAGEKTENSLGGKDYWVVKLNASGAIQWQNTIGGSLDDRLRSIQQTEDGGYIIGGRSNSNISGDKTENSRGDADYWVVKLNSLGGIQWQKTLGGNAIDHLRTLQQTSDGGYILGGRSNSNISSEKTENSQGGLDYWVVKLDNSGAIQWQNTIGGSQNEHLRTIQQTSDGGYILGGFSLSNISGDKTENSLGVFDFWVVKLHASGGIQWQNTIGGNAGDFLYSIQQTSDGGYILGGSSSSNISGDKSENNMGMDDYWVLKLYPTGDIEWENTIGGNESDGLLSIDLTDDGGFILGGWSHSNISGDKTDTSRGGGDYWVMKLCGYETTTITQNICEGDSVLLFGAYQNTPGVYYDTLNNINGCDSIIATTLIINSILVNPVITPTGPTSFCDGDNVILITNNVSGNIWSTGDTTQFITVTTSGAYTVSFTDLYDCSATSSTTDITVNPLPTANLGADITICNTCSTTLDAGVGFTDYNWSTGDTTQIINVNSTGTYTVTVTDANNCIGGDTITVNITTGIAVNNIQNAVKIYPNPNIGEFTLEINLADSRDIELKIVNILGQQVYFEKLKQFEGTYLKQIDLSTYPTGVYNLQLISSEGIINKLPHKIYSKNIVLY